ncbi:MAG: hypothetical protein E6600_11435 [Anaerocolumna aminovalerica]|uniref:hypothetical protein n=1 Tax=Anaerocolumna aminovalerica TaxID=1527 RepID=UPI00290B375D|nr:hypothetical protein [Anaerocolumna aminovalerica]MDU6265101.1 hypothetical protein [Anaerocolumna aminovalerica]
MKYKVNVQVPVEKRGLFAVKKTVKETGTIEVDEKRLYNVEEMMLYDYIRR